jgi:protease-4
MDSNLPPENTPPSYPPPPPPPPAYNRSPPVIAVTPPAQRKRGRGWMIAAIVLVVLLMFSVLFNFGQAISSLSGGRIRTSYRSYGPRLEEVTVRDARTANKIAIIPVEGIISGERGDGGFSMVSVIKEQLKRARYDSDVKAVILKVDSPGGEVLASDDIANAIREFETKSAKPVVVSMGSLAASGGYYVSVPCDWIVANELTITGSIGVIMSGLNYRGLLDKVGVQPMVFKSGKFKDMLSSTKTPEEITPEEKQMVQSLIDETFGRFKKVVKDGREAAFKKNARTDPTVSQGLNRDWADYADGRILSGIEAKRLGFVDELGDFDVAVDRAKTLSRIPSAELIQYQPVLDFSNLFRLLGKSDAKAVKLDLGVDVPRLHAGYMYFLSPTYLQ